MFVNWIRFYILLILQIVITIESKDKCSTCILIVDRFKLGLSRTSKSNFGGGNTQWENKKLGSYIYSETRFLEIMEGICKGESKECHQMLEEIEESIEQWWQRTYIKGIESDLREVLCNRRLKVCCPSGTFGPNCKECKGGKHSPCNGHGRCIGDGTKNGTGDCECEPGYEGERCTECSKGHFQNTSIKNSIACLPCHISCKLSCRDDSPMGCQACKDGWIMSEDKGCSDLNECEDDSMCASNEFCTNTEGSYKCSGCHKACFKCLGPLQTDCLECNKLFYKNENNLCTSCHEACKSSCTDSSLHTCYACAKGWSMNFNSTCQDLNECEVNSKSCSNDEYCINTIGSFKCSTCHSSCDGCIGPGNNKCLKCKQGFTFNTIKQCLDIDECSVDADLCKGEYMKCINLPGTYKCACERDYKNVKNKCLNNLEANKIKNFEEDDDEDIEYNNSKKKYDSNNSKNKPSSGKNAKVTATAANKKSPGKVKKANKNTPFYQNDLFRFFCRLAAYALVCVFLKRKIILQSVLTSIVSVYMYYFSTELDSGYKKYK